jgi:transcriptional regulator with GAF, ATPase, and Fis domain
VGQVPDLPLLGSFLQEREFERLGGSLRTVHVDVRIVAATNQNLAQMVNQRKFRAGLYYRLNVFPITLPAPRSSGGHSPAGPAFRPRSFGSHEQADR